MSFEEMKELSVRQILAKGWNIYIKNALWFSVICIVPYLFTELFRILLPDLIHAVHTYNILFFIAWLGFIMFPPVCWLIIYILVVYMVCMIEKGKTISLDMLSLGIKKMGLNTIISVYKILS